MRNKKDPQKLRAFEISWEVVDLYLSYFK